jgi:hypothetical protein
VIIPQLHFFVKTKLKLKPDLYGRCGLA